MNAPDLKGTIWHHMDATTIAAAGPWVRAADYQEATKRIAELEEALANVMGHIDTPVGRRFLRITDPHPEWLTKARATLGIKK